MGTPAATPLAVPEDFPVSWPRAEDAALLWQWDQTHLPNPVSPLGFDLHQLAFGPGMSKGIRATGIPYEIRSIQVNTFAYDAYLRGYDTSNEAERQALVARLLEDAVTVQVRWRTEYLAEVEAASQRLLDVDYAAARLPALAALVAWLLETTVRMWEIHGLITPGFAIARAFGDICARLLDVPAVDAYAVLAGEANLSVESASKLWQLVQAAPEEVQTLLRTRGAVAARVQLQESTAGQRFLSDLSSYLQVYGWRRSNFDLMEPSWVEAPQLALDQGQRLLLSELDPLDKQRHAAAQAAAQLVAYRARLREDAGRLAQFDRVYTAARHASALQEDHNFYLDQKFLTLGRLPFLETGRRLVAAGLLEQTEDVFYLRLAELQRFLHSDGVILQAAVQSRRAELQRWQGYTPPPQIGSRPAVERVSFFSSVFFGEAVEQSADLREVRGQPASGGRVTGTARVVRHLREAERLEEGDILICEMTTPAWTALFPSLAGIVADSGGALSHCAIVAREYGIPCVVGTRVGTRRIADGARITVDGTAGRVFIEP